MRGILFNQKCDEGNKKEESQVLVGLLGRNNGFDKTGDIYKAKEKVMGFT